MSRLRPIPPQELDARQQQVYDAITTGPRGLVVDDVGALRGPFDPMLRLPAVGLPLQEVGAQLRFFGDLPDDIRELTVLVVAREWRCALEWRVHAAFAVAQGIPEAAVAAIRRGERPDLADPRLTLVHDAVREFLDSKRLAESTYDALRALLGETRVVELILVVGYYAMLGGLLGGLEIGADWTDQ